MRSIRLGLYLIIAIYSFAFFLITILTNDNSIIDTYFNELKGPVRDAYFYGINTMLKSSFLVLSASFFFISYLIVKNRRNSERKQLFYISQIIFFILLLFCNRFQLNLLLGVSTLSTYCIFGIYEIFAVYVLGEFQTQKPKLKGKIYWAGSLIVVISAVNFIFTEDELINKLITNLLQLWIFILLLTFSWDIMYSKIQKLKKISAKYYQQKQLKSTPERIDVGSEE